MDGILTTTSLVAMACMGMIDSCDKIVVRNLCFSYETKNNRRLKAIQNTYNEYYGKIYSCENNLIFVDEVTLSSVLAIGNNLNDTLLDKFGKENAQLLLLGCTEKDLNVSPKNGMIGNSTLGEAYFSSLSALDNLYIDDVTRKFLGAETIIINCGDYCIDSTAATFIPLESRLLAADITRVADSRIYRYTVLSGPCVKPYHRIRLRNPTAFGSDCPEEIELFDIPMFANRIKNLFSKASEEDKELMNQDIINLAIEYSRVYSKDNDYRQLDPKAYLGRFIENLMLSEGNVSATFVNLKTDGSKVLPLDIGSEDFVPDNGQNKLNIINLLNALVVMEIEGNYKNYVDGGVYSFGCNVGSKFNVHNLFDKNQRQKLFQFLLSALLIRIYLYNLLDENDSFQEQVKRILKDICDNYFFAVIDILMEMDDYSELSVIVPDDIRSCIEYARGAKNEWSVKEAKYEDIKTFMNILLDHLTERLCASLDISSNQYKVSAYSLFNKIDCDYNKHSVDETAHDCSWRLVKSVVKNSTEFSKMVII